MPVPSFASAATGLQTLPGPAGQYRYTFAAMACRCEVVLGGLSEAHSLRLAQLAADEVRRIEAKYSRYRADSVLSRLNRHAGGEWQTLDEETAALLQYAEQLFEESGGLFDITAGVLRRAWDFRSQQPATDAALAPLLALVGWRKVQRRQHAGQHQLCLPLSGMELDFGGFGKEYAADRAAALLQAHGVQHGYVNLGGDLRILGAQTDGRPWQIAIAHPRQPGQSIAHISLVSGALATSGDYERFLLDAGGQRHCHILLPHNGRSVRHFQSVSVIAPLTLTAGSICTLAMLMQADGVAYLRDSGLAWLSIGPDGQMQHADLPGI